MTEHGIVYILVALLLGLFAMREFGRWTKDSSDPFNVRDLFMENGRASKGSVILLGTFVATTLFFVYYTVTGKMTEGYFGLYSAAWIAPTVTRMIVNAPSEAK